MSGQAAFDTLVRPAALCRGLTTENRKAGWNEETELNGVEEERDEMSDEEGDEIDGEEELAAPHRRVRAGPRNKPTQREREEHEATHVPFRDWCAHCMIGRGRTHHRHGLFLHENGICPECPSDLRRIDYLRRGEGGQTPKHHERRGVEEGSMQCSHATVNRVKTRCLKETEIMNTETVSRVVFILFLDLLTRQMLGNHSLMETRIICLIKQGLNL